MSSLQKKVQHYIESHYTVNRSLDYLEFKNFDNSIAIWSNSLYFFIQIYKVNKANYKTVFGIKQNYHLNVLALSAEKNLKVYFFFLFSSKALIDNLIRILGLKASLN